MATENRSPGAQKATARAKGLEALVESVQEKQEATLAVEAVVKLPPRTGSAQDLGGDVEAIVVSPWASLDGVVVFRGDVVKVTEKVASENESLVRL